MISALDTNVLLDLLIPGASHADASAFRLAEAAREGAVVISEAVYAELAGRFEQSADMERFVDDTGIRLMPSSRETLHRAGAAWRSYARRRQRSLTCPRCGAAQPDRCEACGTGIQVRQHIVADFMIGAHAAVQAERLITRDRGTTDGTSPISNSADSRG